LQNRAIRRSEIVAVLALATDLAIGQPMQFAYRSCVLALRLADRLGKPAAERREVYFQALLRYIGCNADTYLLSALFGDEMAFRRNLARVDFANDAEVVRVVARAMLRSRPESGWLKNVGAVIGGLARAKGASVPVLAGHCEVAERIAARLGLGAVVAHNLGQLYERWDGRGLPHGLRGDAVSPAVRIVTVAQDAIVLADAFGVNGARVAIAKRSGAAYDPDVANAYLRVGADLHHDLDRNFETDEIIALEPSEPTPLSEPELDEAFLIIADFADMRAPWLVGHSRAVADLATSAGAALGLPPADLVVLRCAGLAHDLGEVAIPVSVWAKRGPLTRQEAAAARLHPFHSQSLLTTAPSLADVGQLVASHHERSDGSGYHRGVGITALPVAARILAAAEAYQTAIEARPYRAARSREAAAAELTAETRMGRLDAEAVTAVLTAAGHRTAAARPLALADLTRREIETLRHLANGLTTKQVAAALGVAPKTADNHVQNVYSKIGVKTRAGAVLFAIENGVATTK
jgi:HD-GYP domain-containing protein (c-di-GMP phosphodiesterase class II)